MNIILFGPPGIGKSTIIGILKRNNIPAIDLEDVYPSKIRFQLPSMVDGVVLGGADLNPARQYPNAIKILLTYESQKVYDAQREARDARQPSKASQKKHSLSEWKNAYYDYYVYLTPNKPESIMIHPVMYQAYADMLRRNYRQRARGINDLDRFTDHLSEMTCMTDYVLEEKGG